MTPPGHAWNEAGQSETPAVELLEKLGYTYLLPEALDAGRDSLRDVVLVARLETALGRLNPWLSDDNLQRAVRAITSVQATSLIEANPDPSRTPNGEILRWALRCRQISRRNEAMAEVEPLTTEDMTNVTNPIPSSTPNPKTPPPPAPTPSSTPTPTPPSPPPSSGGSTSH